MAVAARPAGHYHDLHASTRITKIVRRCDDRPMGFFALFSLAPPPSPPFLVLAPLLESGPRQTARQPIPVWNPSSPAVRRSLAGAQTRGNLITPRQRATKLAGRTPFFSAFVMRLAGVPASCVTRSRLVTAVAAVNRLRVFCLASVLRIVFRRRAVDNPVLFEHVR